MRFLTIIMVLPLAILIAGPAMGAGKAKKSKPQSQSVIPIKESQVEPEPAKPEETATQISPDKESPAAGEQINWQVLSGGGGAMSTTGYMIQGTLGQTAAGWTSSASHSVHQGYWQNFGSGTCCEVPGDANSDDVCDIGDCAYIIAYIWREGPYPECMKEGDANVDCTVDVGDVVYIINYIFREGPYPECGCWVY